MSDVVGHIILYVHRCADDNNIYINLQNYRIHRHSVSALKLLYLNMYIIYFKHSTGFTI
jgi:hypothetical protein